MTLSSGGSQRIVGSPPADLLRLATEGDADTRRALATNPQSPHEAFLILANNGEPAVRIALAGCCYAPPEALRALADACDSNVDVLLLGVAALRYASKSTRPAWNAPIS